MREITFVSARVAVEMEPCPRTAMISITEPREPSPVKSGWGAFLHLQFTDTVYDENVAAMMADGFEDAFAESFSGAQAAGTRSFLDQVHSCAGISRLVVHCHAGRSRSAAIALYAATNYGAKLIGDPRERNELVLALLKNPWRYSHLWDRPAKPSAPVMNPSDGPFSAIFRFFGAGT